ncbi:short-chain dehydrogenase/reductase SDR [Leptothrix cholodnii SP-6]|uniref:Short-chain dehydrogenase/reductase SDR n=1 Tax=Leptothrix cholodnii (strain ATCC 51168 / LMG 8142 / SP-6) TaxID=395495 RepID=B1Y0E1_LEPCP|nr:SDR family NAD(P)-dependent oxidoreductase [Leptothrix cholodnii]ACB36620.1 short-chain dehydrogenase/reductase SDR [Leptothrix cholodnii SP-6]
MNTQNPQKPIDRLPPNGFPTGFRALVIGASGAIGAAMVAQLRADPACSAVVALHRRSQPAIDFEREDSIAAAAAELAAQAPFHLIVNAAGLLHADAGNGTDGFMPEKKLGDIEMAQMLDTFRVNTFGPALLLRHFSRLLDRQRGVLALLSAKVGSIEDNRLGGWYSYRASKAALNMFIKTAAIELKRSQPQAVVVALHPGTVNSRLSMPFRGAEIGRSPEVAAAEMLAVLAGLAPGDSGQFVAYDGQRLPW